jgi:phosphoglycerate dehydrogenase-like enzyme
MSQSSRRYVLSQSSLPVEAHVDSVQLGMIGVGSMGGSMSLLYAEYGVEVHYYDPGMLLCS